MSKPLPKGFRLTSKSLPRLGRSVIILLNDGTYQRAVRTDTSFYPEGFCYETVNYDDIRAYRVIAWKDGRK